MSEYPAEGTGEARLPDSLPPGQLGFVRRVNKAGEVIDDTLDEDQTAENYHLGLLPLIAGTKVHAGIAAGSTLESESLEEWWNTLNSDAPTLYQLWSLLAIEAVEPVHALVQAPDGFVGTTLHEVRLSQSKRSFKSASILEDLLVDEQLDNNGTDGQLASALRHNKAFTEPGESRRKFKGMLGKLVDFPLKKKELAKHVHNVRTHHFAHGGDLIMIQTARADMINMQHREGDFEAEAVETAFATVLNSGKAYDPDKLATMKIDYTPPEGKQEISGAEAIHKAAGLIRSGRLSFEILEMKTLPHVGEVYDGLDEMWAEYNGDLNELFSYENLSKNTPEHKQLWSLWTSMEYDVAKTFMAFRNLFRIAEKEFHAANPDFNEPVYRTDEIMPFVQGSVVVIDFDIRGNGEVGKLDDDDQVLTYETSPSLDTIGVPAHVGVARLPVKFERIERHWQHWERFVYELHSMGRLAIHGAKKDKKDS